MYMLKEIEALVYQVIKPSDFTGANDVECDRLQVDFVSECAQAKFLFKDTIVSQWEESHLQRFYQSHQANLIQLIMLLENESPANRRQPFKRIRLSFKDSLYDLLLFLKAQFPNYFNYSMVAPTDWKEKILKDVSFGMAQLHDISFRSSMDKELFDLASRPLDELVQGNAHEYTFSQLGYLQLLQESLLKFDPSVSDAVLVNQDFISLLIQLNFNSHGFVRFCSRHITSGLAVTETLADRIDHASYYLKIVSQTDVLPGVSFDDSAPSVKDQLFEWISAELEYLKQKRFLQISCPPKDEMIRDDFKLNFDLSVAHLAYLFKTFIETGVLQNKNASELIRFLAKFVKTKKMESVSYESFRHRFYNTESGTKDAVKKLLQLLLSYVSKN